MMTLQLTGNWMQAKRIVISMDWKFRRSIREALVLEAKYLREKMVQGIQSQAPGGKSFRPVSALTLALRSMQGGSGSKALIASGGLIEAIAVPGPDSKAFVGVRRGAKARNGRSYTAIAKDAEYGARIRRTQRMTRFIAAVARQAGLELARGDSGQGGGDKYIVIPPRPFIRPVIEAHATPAQVKKRMRDRIARGMDNDLGR